MFRLEPHTFLRRCPLCSRVCWAVKRKAIICIEGDPSLSLINFYPEEKAQVTLRLQTYPSNTHTHLSSNIRAPDSTRCDLNENPKSFGKSEQRCTLPIAACRDRRTLSLDPNSFSTKRVCRQLLSPQIDHPFIHSSTKLSNHPSSPTRMHVSIIRPSTNPFTSLFLYPCTCTWPRSYIYIYIHVSIHLFIHSVIQTSIHPSMDPFIYTNTHPSIHAPILSPMYLYNHSFIHLSIHPRVHTYTHASIHLTLTHPSMNPYMRT